MMPTIRGWDEHGVRPAPRTQPGRNLVLGTFGTRNVHIFYHYWYEPKGNCRPGPHWTRTMHGTLGMLYGESCWKRAVRPERWLGQPADR
jgi:hypothetical protein